MKCDLDIFRGNTWNPMRELFLLQREINRLFDGQLFESGLGFSNHPRSLEVAFTPACDVEETDTQYLMSFELPGVPKENVKIELHDRQLVVSGEKNEEHKDDSKSRHVTERIHGSFKRVFALPTTVSAEKVEASFENGVLKIALPKTQLSQPKQIKITEGKAASAATKEAAKPKENGKTASRVAW